MATAVALYTQPQELVDHLVDLLEVNAGELGLRFVGSYTSLIPEYPAAVVTSGGKTKELHSTHKFSVMLEAEVTVLHAKLDVSRSIRQREDNDLAAAIESLIEEDVTFGNHLVQGWVALVQPGVATRVRNEQIAVTRLLVTALSQQRFR